jgi:hypothetical protein
MANEVSSFEALLKCERGPYFGIGFANFDIDDGTVAMAFSPIESIIAYR